MFPTAAGTSVGIGTSSPGNRLHIITGTAGQSGLRLGNLAGYTPVSNATKILSTNALGDVGLYNLATLYSGDGTLADNRIVTLNSKSFTFRPSNLGNDVFINGTTGNVGIGTSVPSVKLDVAGITKAYQGIFNSNLANGQTFTDLLDRNDKSIVLTAGRPIGSGSGYNNTRMFNFFDFPVSNIDAKATVYFGIEDRGDVGRYRFFAQALGETQMSINNKNQQEIFKFYEDGNDNAYLCLPKTTSRFIIGDTGAYLPQYKFVVRGNSKIEGDIITDANIGIGTTNFTDGVDAYKLR